MNVRAKRMMGALALVAVFGAGAALGPGSASAQESDAPKTVVEDAEAPSGDCDLLLEDFEVSEEDLAEWNAETQSIIDALEAAGITVDVLDNEGLLDFDYGELTEEQEEAVDAAFEEIADGQFSMGFEMSAEDLAIMAAEEEALANHLDGLGIAYTWVNEEDGFRYIEVDWEDKAAVDAYSGYWVDLMGDELGDLDFDLDPADHETEDVDS